MSNSIVQGSRVAPWIGIGVSGQWKSSAEALEASKLDFDVRQERLFWRREEDYNGTSLVYDEPAPMFANVRNTDDELLGCVTPQYRIIQNKDAFSLLDPFLGNGTITHAGMTADGLCFMIAEVGLETIGGEDYVINLMATNSFNTKYPCQIIMTPIRIICQNMYRKLVHDRVFLAKHTLTADERLRMIANGNMVEKRVLAFSSIIDQAQSRHLSMSKLELLVAMMFPYPKEGSQRELAYKVRKDEERKQFIDRYFDAPDNRPHQGSAFGFVNAYFDYLSHGDARQNTSTPWVDRRFSGIVSGNNIDRQLLKEAMK